MSVAKEGSLNEVEILLEKPLLPNTKYSLLTVAGAEGSIDFTTPAAVEGYTQANLASTAAQDIAHIEMIDATTILVRYVQNISGASYDYKLLAENKVVKIEKPSYENPEIIISVEPPLESEQNYIMMVVDMKDVDGKQLEFDTGIYDFTTPVFPEVVVQETTPTAEENLDLKAAPEAAPEQVSLVKEAVELTAEDQSTVQNVEQIAASVQETPETGATTWVLICITLIINTFLFFTRRKKV